MTNTKNTRSQFTMLLAGAALSATALVAVPAHAGPLSFLKKVVKQELSELAQETAQGAVDAATGTVKARKTGKTDATWKVEEGEAAASGDGGFRQEGGTTVPTADDLLAPEDEGEALLLPAVQAAREAARPQRSKMSQNGTTVETANEVQAPAPPGAALAGDEHEITYDIAAQRAKLSQNGTTVAIANEVLAPQKPERAKLKQNGTTVATAGEVQAPQSSQASTEPKLPKFRREKGTTVHTADDVAAPSR